MCCDGGECTKFDGCLNVQIHPWPNTVCFVFRAKELTSVSVMSLHNFEFFLAWVRVMYNTVKTKLVFAVKS